MKFIKRILAGTMSLVMAVSMISGYTSTAAFAETSSFASSSNTDSVNNILIKGDKINWFSSSSKSETSTISFASVNDVKYNNHGTVKVDYYMNQNDSYGGYAGTKLGGDSSVLTNGATGIGFWYMTPENVSGTIALCMQGSVSKKLVSLSTTNGKWTYFYNDYSFTGSDMSDIEIYINGNENNYVTNPANGSIYIAELAATNIKEVKTETKKFTLETSVEGNGTVSGTANGTYDKGTSVTLTASPKDGNTFAGWKINGQTVSSSLTYSFNIEADTEIKAVFIENTTKYCTLEAYATEGGKVLNGGTRTYPAGAGISLTAVADEGYIFIGWSYTEDGEIVFKDANYISKLSSDLTLYARFKKIEKYTYNVTAGEGGIVNGTASGTYEVGTVIRTSVQANDGYEFANWTDSTGKVISTDANYAFLLKEDTTLKANFTKIVGTTYELTVKADKYGSVSGTASGTYAEGTKVTLTAKPDEGYILRGWKISGETRYISTDETYSFTLNKDIQITAEFCQYSFLNHLVVIAGEGGTVSDVSGYYSPGQSIKVFAEANKGYRFLGWSTEENGEITITTNPFVTSPSKLSTYYANFMKIPDNTYYLTVLKTSYGILTGPSTDDYPIGSELTISIEPKKGYVFEGWYDGNGNLLSTDSTYTFIMDSDKSITPKCDVDTRPYYSVKINDSENGTFSGLVSDTYPEGTEYTLKAIPNSGYEFIGWKIDDTNAYASIKSTFTLKIEKDITLTPIFAKTNTNTFYYMGLSTAQGGSVTGQKGYYAKNDSTVIKAIPEEGFKFTGWSNEKGGSIVSKSTTLTVTLTDNVDYYANFAEDIDWNMLATGINNNGGSMNNDSGSSVTFTPNSMDYPFRYRGALKIDFDINTDNPYGGYAGRPLTLEHSSYTYPSTCPIEGIDFWYLTPEGYDGDIALCIQSASTGLNDLVQLISTNGEWRHFIYKTNKARASDLTLYINGSKNGFVTERTINIDKHKGTLYLANIRSIYNIQGELKKSILYKNSSYLTEEQLNDFSSIINKWSVDQLMLYDKMSDNASKNQYHSGRVGEGYYFDMKKIISMEINTTGSEGYVGRRNSKADWIVKFHEEGHQLMDSVKKSEASLAGVFNDALIADATEMINAAIDWKYGKNSDVPYVTNIEKVSDEAEAAMCEWYINYCNSGNVNVRSTQIFADAIGYTSKGTCDLNSCASSIPDGYFGHDVYDYRRFGVYRGNDECWAEYVTFSFYSTDKQKATIKELLPRTSALMGSKLDGLREYSNNHCLTFYHYASK